MPAETPWVRPALLQERAEEGVRCLTCERRCTLAEGQEGLSFVYIGNVPGHRGSDTHCPGCGTTLIRRRGLSVRENVLDDGCCPHCEYRLPGRYA